MAKNWLNKDTKNNIKKVRAGLNIFLADAYKQLGKISDEEIDLENQIAEAEDFLDVLENVVGR